MKLVTWNIQWGRGADGRVSLDRIVAQARATADVDVLCLQEVSAGYPELPGCDGGDQFAALGARLAGYTAVAAPAVDAPAPRGGRRAFGNMIFSRWPVGLVRRHLLPWPADAGVRRMQRVALEAALETPFGPLRVSTTHLEYYSLHQRLAQVERLRELHREAVAQAGDARPGSAADGPFERLPCGGAALLAGDFNFRPASAEHARLLAPIDADTPAWRDAWQVAHPGQPHAPTVGLRGKAQWPGAAFACDFVFVSADLAPRVRDVRVDAAAGGSDHQPVLLELA